MQFGAALGNAIGRAISGQDTQHAPSAPDPAQGERARARLDEWANENPDEPPVVNPEANVDHGGLLAAKVENGENSGGENDDSPNATLRVINQTNSYVTVSVDGSYGCNTAGGTSCTIPVRKGNHYLRAVRSDTGASFDQTIDVSGREVVWSLNGV